MNTDLATPQRSYRHLLLSAAAIMLALGGAYGVIHLRYTVQGVALPLVAIDSLPHPPPAWLIVDNTAIPATFGDYCWHHPLWGGECVTAPRAEDIPDLATVTLPANRAPVIVVEQRGTRIQPTVRAWNSQVVPGYGRQLQSTSDPEGRFSTFILQPLDQIEDQVLEVNIMPSGTKRATYLWHLNPQP